ncbi:alkane 1-monooxygenase [Yoonia sp. 208BN28-4]|uniref:alkane 1-monooxygenase n=1 Tax=Yoonia sp. 208BN28-4 TaxID=3126505 RepID=UPI0030A562B7
MLSRPMILFGFATLMPLALLTLAALQGGWWVLAALVFLTVLTGSLDELVRRVSPPTSESEFPAADALLVALGIGHFVLLLVVVTTLAGDTLALWEKLPLFFAAGLFFGQVSNSNAHELIHRGSRALHRLGMWIYISMLFGHHTSAHVLVHHRLVATRDDPSTSRIGESLYRYVIRAWRGSFVSGYKAEASRLAKINRPAWRNPYWLYIAGAAGFVLWAYVLAGGKGVFVYICLVGFAQFQLLMSDYVQHYGLSRAVREDGRPEPVGDRHSWNSPHWFSSALMLNAPRHAAHHAHPSRPYASLDLPEDSPMLPRSLPVMACIALHPRLWRKVMDDRARVWRPA